MLDSARNYTITIFCRSVNAFTPWKYHCGPENYCIKLPSLNDPNGISLTECKLTCGKNLQLWPLPTGKTELSKVKTEFVSNLKTGQLIFDSQILLNLISKTCASKGQLILKTNFEFSS